MLRLKTLYSFDNLYSRETMLIVWQRALCGKNSFDGAVDIREIKEVRKGKQSRDFDKWSEDKAGLEVLM